MEELLNLLSQISQNIEFMNAISDEDEDEIRKISDDYFKSFKGIYERIERHRYSEVSRFIGGLQGDTMDSLIQGIHHILDSAEKNYYDCDEEDPANKSCYKSLTKLYDHIELEVLHVSSARRTDLLAKKNEEKAEELSHLLDNANEQVEIAEDKCKHLSEQLISILGIFAGIVTAFAFAVTTIGEALANLTNTNAGYLAFIILVLGLVFVNAVVLLLTFVTKLSGQSLKQKFPLVIYLITNVILIGCIIFFAYKFNLFEKTEVTQEIGSTEDTIICNTTSLDFTTG